MHLTVLMMIVTTTTVSQTTNRCSGTSDRRKHRLSRLRTFSRSGGSQQTTAENEALRMTKFLSARPIDTRVWGWKVKLIGEADPDQGGKVTSSSKAIDSPAYTSTLLLYTGSIVVSL